MEVKKTKSHTSNRKKASAATSTPRRTKKAASKARKLPAKSKAPKNKDEAARLRREKKLEELTLRAFRMAYESNQRGEFNRL